MGERLSSMYGGAVARYGDLGLSDCAFAARVLQICPELDVSAPTTQIHAEDLYLTSACAAGSETAWRLLDAEYRSHVLACCQSFLGSWHQAQDVADVVWASLFLPGRNGQPRIGSYEGTCALGTWLRTIAARRALNYRNQASRALKRLDHLPAAEGSGSLEVLEENWSEQRVKPLLKQSLRAACSVLGESDSLLLVWRFDQDIAIGEIARRLGVHQSTVTRRIERVCARLRRWAGQKLASEFHLDRDGIDECFQLARSGTIQDLGLLPVIRIRAANLMNCSGSAPAA